MHLHLEGAVKHAVEVGHGRVIFVALIFVLCFVVIAGRLIELSMDRDKAGIRHISMIGDTGLKLERAAIYDRNGQLLATNLKTQSLFANCREIMDPVEAAKKLVTVLPELDYDQLLERLSSDKVFVWLKRNLHPSEVLAVNNLGIPGLNFQNDEKRTYPQGDLFSHVLGFVGDDGVGLAGIEKEFDCMLQIDSDNRRCAKGQNVTLSVDMRVQDIMYHELMKQYVAHKAKAAAGIVLDVRTGEIISMVSLPDFNGNNPSKIDMDTTFSYATKALYEMGSTFKSFTMAAALDYDKSTMKDKYDASKPIKVSRFTIDDYHGQDRVLTLPEVYMYSSNIGTAKIIEEVGADLQQKFLSKLGLLNEIDLEIPETAIPQYPENWGRISTITVSYGHGISVTPLHVAAAIAALVNGGIYHSPTLIKGKKSEGKRVIKEITSENMRKLMRLVVSNKEGTGKKADVEGYFVGGKTGTADKPDGKRYDGRAVVSSFVAAFPMTDPRYVVMALVDEPKGNKESWGFRTAGWTAAPVVKGVIEQIGPILGVAPVDEDDEAVKKRFEIKF